MSYLFTAYAVVWILLFAYIMSVSSKQKQLDQEIGTLRQILEKKK